MSVLMIGSKNNGFWVGALKNPSKCLWHENPKVGQISSFRLTSMWRHIYDRNTVGCDLKQRINHTKQIIPILVKIANFYISENKRFSICICTYEFRTSLGTSILHITEKLFVEVHGLNCEFSHLWNLIYIYPWPQIYWVQKETIHTKYLY